MSDDLRLEALHGVVRRVAASRVAADLVLRGGLVTRSFVGPIRNVEDADFLARFPFDAAATVDRISAALATPADDGFSYAITSSEVIWAETAFPGVRVRAAAARGGASLDIQIDTGFGDPMVPDPEPRDVGAGVPILACRAETLFGWKVHGLFERGKGRWRPKDLWDLWLLAHHAPLDRGVLPASIRTAFETRGDPVSLVARVAPGTFGTSPWSRRKWESFCRDNPQVPRDLDHVIDLVAQVLRPIATAFDAG
jgi:hypothetical protein